MEEAPDNHPHMNVSTYTQHVSCSRMRNTSVSRHIHIHHRAPRASRSQASHRVYHALEASHAHNTCAPSYGLLQCL